MKAEFSKSWRQVFGEALRNPLRFLASLRIAVLVILGLAALTAVGTFVEAEYDAAAASRLVYRTPWMFAVMGLLAINLTAVMADRWPWKKRHIPFLLAHIGILVLLAGSLVTYFWGVDGSMRVGIGEANRFVAIPNTELTVWSSFDGNSFSKVAHKEVDFFKVPPPNVAYDFTGFGETVFRVLEFHPYVMSSRKIVASSNPSMGAGLRFLLQNARVNQSEWVLERRPGELATQDLGPAAIHLGPPISKGRGRNEIFIEPVQSRFRYSLFTRDSDTPKTGFLEMGDALNTPWMGLVFRILFYHPHAEETWDVQAVARPSDVTTSAIKILFNGEQHWIHLNDVVKLFKDNVVYVVSFANRRLDLGFAVQLKEFRVGRYQGTNKAMTYESHVRVIDGPASEVAQAPSYEQVISMNEPLKHNRYTVYQASFQESAEGTPTASIFSINSDPGRWVKYLGSLILSLGVVWMFYNRRKATRAQAPGRGEEVMR